MLTLINEIYNLYLYSTLDSFVYKVWFIETHLVSQKYQSYCLLSYLGAIQYSFSKAVICSNNMPLLRISAMGIEHTECSKASIQRSSILQYKNIKLFQLCLKTFCIKFVLLHDVENQTFDLPSTAHTSHGGHQKRQQPEARSRSLEGCWTVITVDAILFYLII